MKVLVIGATGYIGRAVSEALVARDHEVRALVREASANRRPAGTHSVVGNVSEPASLVAAAGDVDAVIYAVQYDGDNAVAAETAALAALAGALAPSRKRMLYTSGVWVYGNTYPNVADENTPLNPLPIVAHRPGLERIVLDKVADGLHAIVVRPGDVYGRGGGIPAMWVQSARDSGAAQIVGDGSNHWPMVHVDDLAQLYMRAIEQAGAGSTYIAVDDIELTVQAMGEAASRGAGANGAIRNVAIEEARKTMGPFADALAVDQRATSAKARRELGWIVRSSSAAEDLQAGSYAQT